jgi:adenosylmethionine-8-amino-7-oxononanoate aminotransferase
MEDNKYLIEADKRYIWHPFTQMKDWVMEDPIIIEEGRGCSIKDTRGRWYLDGVSSLWVNIHGHRKKEIDDAIRAQLDRISHTTMLGLSNVPAIKLAERLVKLIGQSLPGRGNPAWLPSSGLQPNTGQTQGIAPTQPTTFNLTPPPPPLVKGGTKGGLSRVFYSDNGSTAVEVGLKMAFQYWKHKGVDRKNSFLSLDNAYHGDTIGAVSVGGVDIFHSAFGPLLFRTHRAPSPYCYRCGLGREFPDCGLQCVKKMEEILADRHEEIAAVILEPMVQAAGGMIVSPPGYLKGVRDLCTRYNVLLIADEVATGFGRTGRMFACEHEGVVPDIICLSKGITGGYMPLAVTVASDQIYDAFLGEFRELKTFFHGHSYTGNPLACAAALACLDVFEREGTINQMQPKIHILENWLKEISGLPHAGDVRNSGLMAGVELVMDKNTKAPYPWEDRIGWRVEAHARDNGVFIRPLGNVIVIMPPLSIKPAELTRMLEVIGAAIKAVT